MISVRGVSKSFGRVHAVRDVSFEAPRGQVVGLLGANGAGKTTTIRMITGFVPPDRGTIAVAGHDTLDDSLAARRAIGYLPEAAPAYGEMTTRGYLDFRGRLYGLDRSERTAAIARVTDMCELREVRDRRVGQLSRGYRQRVGLAAAVLHNPPVLILDEPTSALDPRQIRQTRMVIRHLATERSVLVSSHILPEVEQTCDRVVIMSRGRVRADGRPAELLATARANAPYIIEARGGDGADVAKVLGDTPGVTSVETESRVEPWVTVRVAGGPGAGDLREAISHQATRHGVVIRELRRQSPGLERLFMELIESDEAPAGAPP
jgi:ABC-2 type transport system ATP-binding protein